MPIAIAVDSAGNINVTPANPPAFKPEDNVQWTVTGASNATVTFDSAAPFGTQSLNVPGVFTISAGAVLGNYPYTVTALGHQSVPPMEPEIIVG